MIRAIVVMGVSGSGKTTLGRALAQRLGWQFAEGDTLHPAANIAKMAAGIALNDDDRRPFLDRVGQVIADSRPQGIVVSCSALKRIYRDRIRLREAHITFVLPVLDRKQLEKRLSGRTGHFMPPSLLDSQLATFEQPQADELAIQIVGDQPLGIQVQQVLDVLHTLDGGPVAALPNC